MSETEYHDEPRQSGMSTGKIVALVLIPVVLLGLCCVGGVFASIMLPALVKVREKANRTKSASNLRQIGVAGLSYEMTSGSNHLPHVQDPDVDDGPGDVGKAFSMLVQAGEIDNADVFICPSSNDMPFQPGPIVSPAGFAFSDDDVRTTTEFSYGWTKRLRSSGSDRSHTAIAADRSVTGLDSGAMVVNHPDGRNLLRLDGSVEFIQRGEEDFDPSLAEALDQLNLADR